MTDRDPRRNEADGAPDLSLVMPCFNEEAIVGYTVPRLLAAFREAGYRLELVAVDNGSTDRTATILRQLAAANPEVAVARVEKNIGYGYGILRGMTRSTAPWVGTIPADGQVDAEDVVRLFDAAITAGGDVLAKVRRRFRMDGLRRKTVSIAYNLFVRMLWPRLASLDVNGTPKILHRDALLAMKLESKGWLLDPEIMVKAHIMGIRVLELNVFARMRGGGLSHVRMETCWEFFWSLLRMRFSRSGSRLRGELARARREAAADNAPDARRDGATVESPQAAMARDHCEC